VAVAVAEKGEKRSLFLLRLKGTYFYQLVFVYACLLYLFVVILIMLQFIQQWLSKEQAAAARTLVTVPTVTKRPQDIEVILYADTK
jgi:hypothetical protein